MWRWSYVLWFLSFVLPLLSQTAFAEVQRFRLDANESQITAKVNDPFGNVVNGSLRVRQGEARGDLDRLAVTGAVNHVIHAERYNSNIALKNQDDQEY